MPTGVEAICEEIGVPHICLAAEIEDELVVRQDKFHLLSWESQREEIAVLPSCARHQMHTKCSGDFLVGVGGRCPG